MFDFREALACIECGQRVQLEIDGKPRVYYMDGADVFCIPNNKEHLAYRVKSFQIDAILSKNWKLAE